MSPAGRQILSYRSHRGSFPGGASGKEPSLSMQEIWEKWFQSPGLKDPLEEGMGIHSSILACRIPWTEEPGGLQSMGLQRVDMTEVT